MIHSEFDHAFSRYVVRCSARNCHAHVAERTPDAAHDEALALGWGTVYGRSARCPAHRVYVAPPRRAVDILRSMVKRGVLVGNETARAMLREWEAA